MKREGKGWVGKVGEGEGEGREAKEGREGKRREGIDPPTFSNLPPPMVAVKNIEPIYWPNILATCSWGSSISKVHTAVRNIGSILGQYFYLGPILHQYWPTFLCY
jgi:hypothetical protein